MYTDHHWYNLSSVDVRSEKEDVLKCVMKRKWKVRTEVFIDHKR